jgi:hypothetical protein
MECSERVFKLAIKERRSGEQKNMGVVVRKIKKDERTRRTARQIVRLAPHLDDAKFRPLVLNFARISLISGDAAAFLRERSIVGDDGELRRSVDTFARLVNVQLKLAEKLGLTPATFVSFTKTKPVDLASAYANAEVVDDDDK